MFQPALISHGRKNVALGGILQRHIIGTALEKMVCFHGIVSALRLCYRLKKAMDIYRVKEPCVG